MSQDAIISRIGARRVRVEFRNVGEISQRLDLGAGIAVDGGGERPHDVSMLVGTSARQSSLPREARDKPAAVASGSSQSRIRAAVEDPASPYCNSGMAQALAGVVRHDVNGIPARLPWETSGRGCAARRPCRRTASGANDKGSSSWAVIAANRVGQPGKFLLESRAYPFEPGLTRC